MHNDDTHLLRGTTAVDVGVLHASSPHKGTHCQRPFPLGPVGLACVANCVHLRPPASTCVNVAMLRTAKHKRVFCAEIVSPLFAQPFP